MKWFVFLLSVFFIIEFAPCSEESRLLGESCLAEGNPYLARTQEDAEKLLDNLGIVGINIYKIVWDSAKQTIDVEKMSVKYQYHIIEETP